MKSPLKLLLLTAVMTLTAHQIFASPTEPNMNAQTKEFAKIQRDYIAAYNRHDAAAVADFLAPNAILISWDGNPIESREQAQEGFAQIFKHNPKIKLTAKLETMRPIGSDGAVITGTITFSGTGPGWPKEGKFLLAVEKKDGKWLIVYDTGFIPAAS